MSRYEIRDTRYEKFLRSFGVSSRRKPEGSDLQTGHYLAMVALYCFGVRTRRNINVKPRISDVSGFTLFEVLLVLLVMSIVAGTVAPSIFKLVDEKRDGSTREEMEAIVRAITGDPFAGQYGYIGDVGGLPAHLSDLNTNPGLPAYGSNHTNGIGMGWNGPYINRGYSADDYLKDAWGNSYSYNSATGQITSAGSDGKQGSQDDITIPPNPVTAWGDISVKVIVADDNNHNIVRNLDNTGCAVWVYYAGDGAENSALAPWDGIIHAFTTQGWTTHPHQGVHAVKAVGLGDYAGNEATANATVVRGTTVLNIFLGIFDLNDGGNGNGNGH